MSPDERFGTEGKGVLLRVKGPVATLLLSRPDKLNAIDLDMLAALEDALDAVEALVDVRAVILAGDGKGFSAGGDVNAWSDMDALAFAHDWVRRGHRVMDRLAQLRQPVIAVLDGHALGGGLELAAAADFRVAESQVMLGMPEAGIGVVPGWSGTQRAVRRFGAQAVRRMALGGEVFFAEEAQRLGLVDRVVPTGAGLEEATTWAEKIAARGPVANEAIKLMIAVAEGEESAGATEALASAFIATTADLKEGVASFREKRRPKFSRG